MLLREIGCSGCNREFRLVVRLVYAEGLPVVVDLPVSPLVPSSKLKEGTAVRFITGLNCDVFLP